MAHVREEFRLEFIGLLSQIFCPLQRLRLFAQSDIADDTLIPQHVAIGILPDAGRDETVDHLPVLFAQLHIIVGHFIVRIDDIGETGAIFGENIRLCDIEFTQFICRVSQQFDRCAVELHELAFHSRKIDGVGKLFEQRFELLLTFMQFPFHLFGMQVVFR